MNISILKIKKLMLYLNLENDNIYEMGLQKGITEDEYLSLYNEVNK